MRVGDLLPAVAGPRDLAQFDWRMTEGPGATIEVQLMRDGATVPARIVLAELL